MASSIEVSKTSGNLTFTEIPADIEEDVRWWKEQIYHGRKPFDLAATQLVRVLVGKYENTGIKIEITR